MAALHGWAGASAEREAARLGRAGGAWAKGAAGEAVVGRVLESIPEVRVLHDRAVPGSRANIDHIAVAAVGVVVIDAKHYAGEPRARHPPGAPHIDALVIDGQDRSDLVASLRRQLGVVAEAVDDPAVPMRAVLCFVGASWGGARGFAVDGVAVTSPEHLPDLLRLPGPLSTEAVAAVHARLQQRLAAAWDA